MTVLRKPARINVKALVILSVITLLLGGGVVTGHFVRKRIMTDNALAAGRAALEKEDWAEACKQIKLYLYKYPDDVEMLEQYAKANLSVRPRERENIAASIDAFRRLLRHRPGDEVICEKLARMYQVYGQFEEAAYICRQRLKVAPTDPTAITSLGRALIAQGKGEEAAALIVPMVEKHHPEAVDAYFLLAGIAMGEDSVEGRRKALEWLDRCVQANPRSAKAYAGRAKFHRGVRRDVQAATADLAQADKLSPTDVEIRLLLGDEWANLGELDRAQAEINAIEKTNYRPQLSDEIEPERVALATFMLRGKLAVAKGDAARIVEVADAALAEQVGSGRAAFLPFGAKLYLAAGNVEQARILVEEYRLAVAEVVGAVASADEHLALLDAAVLAAEGHPHAVINLLEEVVARSADNLNAWKRLADAYEGTRQGHRAVAALEECAARQPDDREVLIRLAKAYQGSDWSSSFRYARACEQLGQQDPQTTMLRIEAELSGGSGRPLTAADLDRISAELAALRQASPRDGDVRMLEASVSTRQGRLTDAVSGLEMARVECEPDLNLMLGLARLYELSEQTDRALALCGQATEQYGDQALAWLALARYQFKTDRMEEVRQTLEHAVSTLSGREKVRVAEALARHMLEQGDRDGGMDRLKQLAQEEPENVTARLALLNLPEVRENPQQAQQIVDELAVIEGQRGLRWKLEQAKIWLRTDEWKARTEETTRMLIRCIDADPTWVAPVIVLGALHERQGRDDQAENAYRRLIETNPRAFEVMDRLLTLLERQGRFVDAATILNRTARSSSDQGVLGQHRIQVAIGRGDFGTAIEELELRVAADPKDAESRVILARLVYNQHQDADRANDLLDQAHDIAPDMLAIVTTRAAILLADGQAQEALAVVDAEVNRREDFAVYLLRARTRAAAERLDLAEEDYIHLTSFTESSAVGFEFLGRFYLQLDRKDEAITAWERGLSQNPGNVQLRRLLISSKVYDPDQDVQSQGLAMLDELLRELPDDPDLLVTRAEILLRGPTLEAINEATRLLKRAIALDNGHVMAYRNLIMVHRRRGQLNEANELVASAVGASPENLDLLMVRAALESEQGNAQLARRLARVAVDKHPGSVTARDLLIDLTIKSGNLDEAESFNETVLSAFPDDETSHLRRARILGAKGEFEAAIRSLKEYVQGDQGRESTKAFVALANLHNRSEDFAVAKTYIERALALDPGNSAARSTYIRWLALQEQFDAIVQALTEYRRQHSQDLATFLVAGFTLLNDAPESYADAAMIALEHATKVDPTNIDALAGLARAAYRAGDPAAAVRTYRRILGINQRHQQTLNDLAWVLADSQQDWQTARKYADRGVLLYPEDPHLRDTRGFVLTGLGEYQAARRDFQLCVELSADKPTTRAKALLRLVGVCRTLGDADSAKRYLMQAQSIDQQMRVFSDQERGEMEDHLRSL